MSRFPFFEKVDVVEAAKCLKLASYTPEIVLEDLSRGVDNLRSDVFLSPKFTEMTQAYILRLLVRHGEVEDLIEEDESKQPPPQRISILSRNRLHSPQTPPKTGDSGGEFKRNLTELQIVALNLAKAQGNISIDLLARLAIVKMIRNELVTQFGHVMERCRARLKGYEGPRANTKGIEFRERYAKLQISKKIVLRKAGQEALATLRDVERETVSRMRRSLFGDMQSAAYELFLNRLLFTEEGRDDYLAAEYYVMLGNFDRDPDRFQLLLEAARAFLRQLEIVPGTEIDGSAYRLA